jgi:1-acyl-sn-glycerol-3-phosphate acyltransferase
MKKKESIHKFSLFYSLLRAYERFAFKRFYRHIQVIGKENIPEGSRYIYTPNHQNALMDALAIVNTSPSTAIFFARADIFRKKRQAKILRSLKILPIYRMRDGASELSKNEEVFQSAITILGDKTPICIMPEGNHGDKRRIRNLVKGVFRIAFRTQQEFMKDQGVKIVPVGLDYEHYVKFFQDLLIVYGEPIEVSEYMDAYRDNNPKGINALRERLRNELKKVSIHIENEEFYPMYQDLREIYNKRMRSKLGIIGKTHYDRFRADKKMISILDKVLSENKDRIEKLAQKTKEYTDSLSKLNIRNWIFERKGFTTRRLIYKRFGLILTFPFFVYGLINNWLPFTLPVRKTRTIKDKQFHSSFKFVMAMILFPVFYALQTFIVAFFTGPAWIAWAYLITLPGFGYFSLFWSIWYKRWKAGLKYRKMKKSRDPLILNLESNYKEIMAEMDSIVYENMNGDKEK